MFPKINISLKTILFILLIVGVSGIPHTLNMFGFPYYENDEGTYMSQAWAVLRQGELAPYTYWYDHAPFGWILITLWVKLTGGFFTFGTSVDSGRVLMLILHVATALLIVFVAKRLTGNYIAGFFAVLIFSLSPLAIYYQRRVLLDNIMTFWVMLSLSILYKKRLSLAAISLSGICWGIAVLTKEVAVIFAPFFLYLLFIKTKNPQRNFGITLFLLSGTGLIAGYFLYAFLKQELFPPGFFGKGGQHVSLLETLRFHSGRGSGLPFWDEKSDFLYNLINDWIIKDPAFVVVISASLVLGFILSIFIKRYRIPTLLALLAVMFLIRGGLILAFYIVPFLPAFVLLIGMLVNDLVSQIPNRLASQTTIIILVVFVVSYFLTFDTRHFTQDETSRQVSAVKFIKQKVPEDSFIAMDASMYVDLHEPGFINNKIYPNADWSWKVARDPEIYDDKLNQNYRNIDYLLLSHEIFKQINDQENPLMKLAFQNSYAVADFYEGSTSYRDVSKLISTNGDWFSLYKVEKRRVGRSLVVNDK